ncbi:hypothetical protein Tco_0393367 [Tanacetum coccineum]
MTCSYRKWELTGIPYKHVVAACWNMTLNGRDIPPPEAWVCSNNVEASGSASEKTQQAEPTVGQDGSGGSSVGFVIGLSAAGGQPGRACVCFGSQSSSPTRWTKRRVQTQRLVQKKELPLNLQPILKCK